MLLLGQVGDLYIHSTGATVAVCKLRQVKLSYFSYARYARNLVACMHGISIRRLNLCFGG